MSEFIKPRTRIWAAACVAIGIGIFVALDLIEDPESTLLDVVLNLLEEIPLVVTAVGIVVLIHVMRQQREENRQLMDDLETARALGRRWRTKARTHLNGLSEAILAQFSRWNLTGAECEVALLLLKGLSCKEVATVRETGESTVREQARAIYAKAGLSGRAALSAYFLEDLLIPTRDLEADQ